MTNAILSPILEQQILPWAEQLELRGLLLAQPTLSAFLQCNQPLPPLIQYARRKIRGHRVASRGRPAKNHITGVTATWPEDHLITSRVPILICALHGQVDYRLSDYTLSLPPGQFCLVPPAAPRTDGSQSHVEGQRPATDKCDLLWLRPDQNGLDVWICHSHGAKHWGGQIGERIYIVDPDALGHIQTIEHETETRPLGWLQMCRHRLLILLLSVQREIAAGRVYGPGDQRPEETISTEWDPIRHAQRYIETHLNEHLTIEQVARASHLARTQFIARFRDETGHSFVEYLTQRRLEKAQSLLRDTNWPVRQIAYLVGLRQTHLRGLFSRHVGLSPRAYQQQVRREQNDTLPTAEL